MASPASATALKGKLLRMRRLAPQDKLNDPPAAACPAVTRSAPPVPNYGDGAAAIVGAMQCRRGACTSEGQLRRRRWTRKTPLALFREGGRSVVARRAQMCHRPALIHLPRR
eukprot:102015-Chlamydomonas_euryale.AAC.1